MKKWLAGLIIVLLLLTASVYIFIPSSKLVSATALVNASPDAAMRKLGSAEGWKEWWPANGKINSDSFFFAERTFYPTRTMFRSVAVTVRHENNTDSSLIVILPIRRDSFEIEWKINFDIAGDPFGRITDLKRSKQLQDDLKHLVDTFVSFIENTGRVYGNTITQTMMKDSIILVSSLQLNSPPTVQQIYGLVKEVKTYAAGKNAIETNHPMLNVDSIRGKYLVRVGLPINKELDVTGTDLAIKRMVLGYVLVSEITGGPNAIKEALRKIEQYIVDNDRRSPAIPYELLITDRSSQPDTTKWITRIYYPVY